MGVVALPRRLTDPRRAWPTSPSGADRQTPRFRSGSRGGPGREDRIGLLDLERALHLGVDVALEEVGAGGLGRNVVDDRLRAGDDFALEDLGATFGLVDGHVVRRALLVVVGDLEGLAGRRLQR